MQENEPRKAMSSDQPKYEEEVGVCDVCGAVPPWHSMKGKELCSELRELRRRVGELERKLAALSRAVTPAIAGSILYK